MRAFPIVYAADVEATAAFYARLGFARTFELPGYVGMERDANDLAVVSRDWPRDHYGIEAGTASMELFVYVTDADATVADLRDNGVTVVRNAEEMPWGERVGFVLDPDGNVVALATAQPSR